MEIRNKDFFSLIIPELSAGRSVTIRVKGDSMKPFITEGSTVLLVPSNKKPGWGEVVLARWQGRFILHRVIWQNRTMCWLAGDNNTGRLERVDKTDILAHVRALADDGTRRSENLDSLGALIWFLLRPARIFCKFLKK